MEPRQVDRSSHIAVTNLVLEFRKIVGLVTQLKS